MLRPAERAAQHSGRNFVREISVKLIWRRGGEGMAHADCDSLTAVTGAKSTGGSMS
jgi:hypothetical protein